jgi:opacity protein-like surface antigen
MKKITLLSFILTLVAAPALAEGMYVGVKLGQTNYDYNSITNNNQAAFGLLAGFIVAENAAIEVAYDNLGGFDHTNGDFSGRAFSLSGVGSVRFNSQFSLFGKLGLASTMLDDRAKSGGDVSYTNTGLNVGLGAQYNISHFVSVRAGVDHFKVGDDISKTARAQMLYLGASFKL